MAWLGAFGLLLLLGVAMVTLLNSRPGEPGPATPPVRQAQVVVATASPAGAPIIPIPTPAERPAPPAAPANVQPTPAPAPPTPPLPTVTPVPEPVRRLTDGQTALARRDWPSAVEQFDKGLALEPANRDLAAGAVQARLGLGDQLWNQGALNEALSQFRAVLAPPLEAAANDQARRQATLARHYLQGEIGWDPDLQAAVGEFQQVYDLEPGYRAARDKLYSGRVILANRLLEGGDRDAAIAQLVAARDLDPDRAEARELLVSLTPTPVPPPPAPPQAPAQPAPQPARPAPAPQPAQPAPQPAQPAPQPAPTPAKQFVPPTPPPAPR